MGHARKNSRPGRDELPLVRFVERCLACEADRSGPKGAKVSEGKMLTLGSALGIDDGLFYTDIPAQLIVRRLSKAGAVIWI